MSDASEVRFGESSKEGPAESDPEFDLLSDHRRRVLLRILRERDADTVECSSLATAIVEREDGDFTVERDLVLIDLHHRHLPKLAEVGVVEYDPQEQIVRSPRDQGIAALALEIA